MGKLDEKKIDHIVTTLGKLEYGSVVITVHDGEITQIETTEKKRFSLSKGNATQTKKY
jgi:hypothetical protein